MHPGIRAEERPDHPALIMAESGATVTYAELDERSNRLAQLLYVAGLREGDRVAVLMENHPAFLEVLWAAVRSGLYLTTINRYLTGEEAGYILADSESKALVSSISMAEVAGELPARAPDCTRRLMVGDVIDGFDSYEAALADYPAEPLPERTRGDIMLYSSGTTGRPKGILRPLSGEAIEKPPMLLRMAQALFGVDGETVYLSPAPFYHTAPLGFCWAIQAAGATVVSMEKFEPSAALAAIERYQVTQSQWVPTMFIRMLKLPATERLRYDLSSHEVAIHAAAPCPAAVKEQMMEWWGPIIHEYYGGTEGNGMTYASPDDWLSHKGTVGKPLYGVIHICDADGNELPTGEPGLVYFEQSEMLFEYHNDPDKTREAQHPGHDNWSTLGDIGYVDEDGFLYLTDRKSFMIISGGVNSYPQEIEDCLYTHRLAAR